MIERRIIVPCETIRRQGRKHDSDYARRARRKALSKVSVRHLDELVVRINSKKC